MKRQSLSMLFALLSNIAVIDLVTLCIEISLPFCNIVSDIKLKQTNKQTILNV